MGGRLAKKPQVKVGRGGRDLKLSEIITIGGKLPSVKSRVVGMGSVKVNGPRGGTMPKRGG